MVQGKLKTSYSFFTDTLNISKTTINSTEEETGFPYVFVHISYLQMTLLERVYVFRRQCHKFRFLFFMVVGLRKNICTRSGIKTHACCNPTLGFSHARIVYAHFFSFLTRFSGVTAVLRNFYARWYFMTVSWIDCSCFTFSQTMFFSNVFLAKYFVSNEFSFSEKFLIQKKVRSCIQFHITKYSQFSPPSF